MGWDSYTQEWYLANDGWSKGPLNGGPERNVEPPSERVATFKHTSEQRSEWSPSEDTFVRVWTREGTTEETITQLLKQYGDSPWRTG